MIDLSLSFLMAALNKFIQRRMGLTRMQPWPT
jgi:hypothetical protein